MEKYNDVVTVSVMWLTDDLVDELFTRVVKLKENIVMWNR